MKKTLAFILTIVLICAGLSGCQKDAASPYKPANDIVTYERVGKSKTTLALGVIGNIAINSVADAFEAENPDVQIITVDITGGTDNYRPAYSWFEGGIAPDVVFSQANFVKAEDQARFFENLSDNPVIDDYTSGSLIRVAVDGNVYMLPGPSTLYCMHYNKTMFEKYGWEVPKTFDEFVQLCGRITRDTEGAVRPFNPNAKYATELNAVLEAMCYEELFGGLENRGWYQGVIDGTERFKGHMEPFYEMVKTLADEGILLPEHFKYSATTRSKEFWAGDIAMMNLSVSTQDAPAFEVGYAPFPSTAGDGYICDVMDVIIGVSKKERGDKQIDAVNRFLRFISTATAQNLLANGRIMFSSIEGSPTLGEGDISELNDTITSGRMFTRLDFADSAVTRDELRESVMSLALGEKTVEQCVEDMDAKLASGAPAKIEFSVVAKAQEDFTILETSNYIADMYRETTGGDIALITTGNAFRGNVMRIFTGDINTEMIKVLLPRSFGNESALVKAEMTGRQIIDALNKPVGANDQAADCVYAYAGLKCTVNPWKPLGEKYLSAALENGAKLDMDKVYTVAFWEGTVYEEFITGEVERYEGTFEELLTRKLEKDKEIKPSKDGRMTLKWE